MMTDENGTQFSSVMNEGTREETPPPTKKKRVYSYRYCPHCQQNVSKTTYYKHKALREGTSLSGLDDSTDSGDDMTLNLSNLQSEDCGNSPISTTMSEGYSKEQTEMEEEDQAFFAEPTLPDELGSDEEQDEEVWSSADEHEEEITLDAPTTFQPLKYLLIFLLLWQSAFRISNAAVSSLVRFLKFFLLILGRSFNVNSINQLAESIPLTIRTMQKSLGMDSNDWLTEYVVCPKCHSIYEYNDCIVTLASGAKESKRCCHVSMPDHPHQRHRASCGTILLKKQRIKKGYRLVARKVYPYRSLKRSITELLNKPCFVEHCEQWRQRERFIPTGYMCDIYDGGVWKNYKDNFLSSPHCYLLTLNVDWFQPFTHITYSTGAIYLTVQNLPRVERYKQENVILVGVMPGPNESSLTINSYLSPLVEELNHFWKGVLIPINKHGGTCTVNVRLALSCVACDIPASRKVCGFVGHNAKLGCNKCLKEFEQYNFSGFDRDNWQSRSVDLHRKQCKTLLKETTKTSLQKAEAKYGVRYSVLLALPNFDPVRYTIIDPMHNLFLGSGKHVFRVWIDLGYLTSAGLLEIENRLKCFRCPPDIGRLPSNISSGYGGFTANQWRNWITIYSAVVLKGILLDSHLRCWLLFVRACFTLQARCVRVSDIKSADLFLLQFCRTFEDIYGPEHCTPNMHLHCHLKECLTDFGPLHAFWCYAFERYNGILGSVHTNRRAIESQLMKKFCLEQESRSLQLPADGDFIALLPQQTSDSSLLDICNTDLDFSNLVKMSHAHLEDIDSFTLASAPFAKGLPPCHEKVLSAQLAQQLQSIYLQLYPNKHIVHMSYFYNEYGRVVLAGDVIGSVKPGPNNSSSSVIMAFWPGTGSSLQAINTERMRVGEVQYFIKHSIKVTTGTDSTGHKTETHLFAYVHWKKNHPHYNWCGISATISSDIIEQPDACCFIPVQRIGARCAFANLPIEFSTHKESVFVTCPIPLKYSI